MLVLFLPLRAQAHLTVWLVTVVTHGKFFVAWWIDELRREHGETSHLPGRAHHLQWNERRAVVRYALRAAKEAFVQGALAWGYTVREIEAAVKDLFPPRLRSY